MDQIYYDDDYDKIYNVIHGGKNKKRFSCEPKNEYKNICVESVDGKYKKKKSCMNDCAKYYVMNELEKAGLKKETSKFYQFIKKIIKEENMTVYIKGGNVIGLKLLSMIYNKYKNDDENFEKYFNELLKMNLIKDWDFSAYTKQKIDDEYHKKIDDIAKEFHLVSRAKTYILYQTKNPIKINDNALFEISVLDDENEKCSNMELPLSTMKIQVTLYNSHEIFMFAKMFYAYQQSNEKIDLEIVKDMIAKMNVLSPLAKNGFYVNNCDDGDFNDKLLKFIDKYKKYDPNIKQFLITHLKTPFRMIYRLIEKNIPKTRKIQKLIDDLYHPGKKIDWLFDADLVENVIDEFTLDFGDRLEREYKEGGIDYVMKFMEGIEKWNRVELEYRKIFTDKHKHLLDNMLNKLMHAIGSENIEKLDNNDHFIKLLKTVNREKIINK